MDTQAAPAQTVAPTQQNNTPPQGQPPQDRAPQNQGGQNQEVKDGNSPSSVVQSKTQPDMYEVTVNGKVHKMTLDQLRNAASMSHAATEKFEEAKRIKRESEEFDQLSKKDMISALRKKGFTNDEIRDQMERWYTETYIDPETLTPEQRKIKEYEAQLKKYQQEEQEKLAKQQQEEHDQLTARQREYLQGQIIDALEKSGLPKTKMIGSRMAFYMRENLLKGWEAPIDVIVQQVKEERQALMSGEVGGLEGEALIQYLGEDVVNKVRKWDLQQLRARKQNAGSLPFNQESGLSNAPGEKIYSSEVTKRLRDMRTGKR